jgi:hypothetical protein
LSSTGSRQGGKSGIQWKGRGVRREKIKNKNMNWSAIRITETIPFLSLTHNWKFPGTDQKPNYWLQDFPHTHSYIMKLCNITTEAPRQIPDWLTRGIMYLLAKSYDTKEPKNYWPITFINYSNNLQKNLITFERTREQGKVSRINYWYQK